MSIQENIARVQERMATACRRSRRRVEDVKLVAVSKTFPAEDILQAYEAGVRDFGENRVQEAAAKRPALARLDITWHLIGHLQTNKAARARELFAWVHSVDSARVAAKLDEGAPNPAERLPILLQVNLGGEESKFGLREEELLRVAEEVSQFRSLEIRGLMLLPPYFENPEESRSYFRSLRRAADQIRCAGLANVSMNELSMGMSHDFEAAIEEGSTIIRVGTVIFGPR